MIHANVTYFGAKVITWVLGQRADVYLIQEHHLTYYKLQLLRKKLQGMYTVIGSPARNTVAGGTSGGALILVKAGREIVPNRTLRRGQELPGTSSHNWALVIIRGKKCNIALGSIYLHPDDRALNLCTMHAIGCNTQMLGCPHLLVGDFNMDVDKLSDLHGLVEEDN